jgi:hypothetical protein
MSDARTFGRAVREARLAKGLSMGQLATAVHRSTASVRRWERDEGIPAAAIMDDLSNALDLTPDDLALVGNDPAALTPPPIHVTTPPPIHTTTPPPVRTTSPPPIHTTTPPSPRTTTPPPMRRTPIQASSQATQAAASRVTGVAAVVEPEATRVKGWLADLYDPDQPWLGYLRAALTVIVLIVLMWLLVWALGGLFDALGEFWESMWAESP